MVFIPVLFRFHDFERFLYGNSRGNSKVFEKTCAQIQFFRHCAWKSHQKKCLEKWLFIWCLAIMSRIPVRMQQTGDVICIRYSPPTSKESDSINACSNTHHCHARTALLTTTRLIDKQIRLWASKYLGSSYLQGLRKECVEIKFRFVTHSVNHIKRSLPYR